MSDDRLDVEATGETVGEAKWSALRELERLDPDVDKSAVRFEVVSEGERGLLGVGYAPARVIATAPRGTPGPAPRPERHPGESDLASHVRELLERITRELGLRAAIDVHESDDRVVASCSGRDLGVLIGKHGQTIDAIQYLVNAIVLRAEGVRPKEVVVDAAGYRERRAQALEALALRSAERVVASGEAVLLEPMTAVERKIVHLRLREFPGVVTSSEGTEPNRYVVLRRGPDDAAPVAEPLGATRDDAAV